MCVKVEVMKYLTQNSFFYFTRSNEAGNFELIKHT